MKSSQIWIRRLVFSIVFALGFALAHDVLGSFATLHGIVFENQAARWLRTQVHETSITPLVRLVNDVVYLLPLSLCAFFSGAVVAATVGSKPASKITWFWVGYACGFLVLLLSWFFEFSIRTWASLIPDVIGTWCTIPASIIGIRSVELARSSSRWRFTLRMLCLTTAIAAGVFITTVSESTWFRTIAYLTMMMVVAWSLLGGRTQAVSGCEL
jgi:hypothetical protein